MAISSSKKARYSTIIIAFFCLFLFSLFYFSKRALEPSLAIYAHFLPHPLTVASTTTQRLPPSSTANTPTPTPSSTAATPTPTPSSTATTPTPTPSSSSSSATATTQGLSQPPSKHPQSLASAVPLPSPSHAHAHTRTQSLLPNAGTPTTAAAAAPKNLDLGEKEKEKEKEKQCDLYTGHWVRDEGYPLYQPDSCPYVDEAFSCQHNGRPDSGYVKWRWKPRSCHLPRFNATDFLVRLRGKQLLLVGDSMNRNQFESMLCLLREALPDKSRMFETRGNKITKGRGYFIFKFMRASCRTCNRIDFTNKLAFVYEKLSIIGSMDPVPVKQMHTKLRFCIFYKKDYNCTVEFCRSHFLVKEGTRLNAKGQSNPTLSIDRIDKSYARWKHADILIFNTGHWWTHGKTSRGKNYYKEGDYLYPEFDAVEAFRRAIRTWGKWIDRNVDPKKKLVFYRGYSTAHFRGGDWDSSGTCNGEKEPIANGSFLDTYPPKMQIVEEVISKMRFPVILLNVTKLTNFRKDGHPSIYRMTPIEGRKLSTRRQDCSHWCLPGVPDAWNELIYASLVMKQTPPLS